MTRHEYKLTSDVCRGTMSIPQNVRPPEGDGWRLHSHSSSYVVDAALVLITYVWEREAES